jgi:hypothetical protein
MHDFNHGLLRFLFDHSMTEFEVLAEVGSHVFSFLEDSDIPDPVLPDDIINVHLVRKRIFKHFPTLLSYDSLIELEVRLFDLDHINIETTPQHSDDEI